MGVLLGALQVGAEVDLEELEASFRGEAVEKAAQCRRVAIGDGAVVGGKDDDMDLVPHAAEGKWGDLSLQVYGEGRLSCAVAAPEEYSDCDGK